MSEPVPVGDKLSYGYCPYCAFPIYRADRFCAGCAAPVPPAPPGSRVVQPFLKKRDVRKVCPTCGLFLQPDRSWCTRCATDLRQVPVQVPRPRRIDRQFRHPALTVSLFVLVVQGLILVGLHYASRGDHSTANRIFVASIEWSGFGNLLVAAVMFVQGVQAGRRKRGRK